jgi:hypothetical protein
MNDFLAGMIVGALLYAVVWQGIRGWYLRAEEKLARRLLRRRRW